MRHVYLSLATRDRLDGTEYGCAYVWIEWSHASGFAGPPYLGPVRIALGRDLLAAAERIAARAGFRIEAGSAWELTEAGAVAWLEVAPVLDDGAASTLSSAG